MKRKDLDRRTPEVIAITLALIVCLISLVVIFGWLSNNTFLLQLAPDFVTMKFNTALLLLLAAMSVIFLALKYPNYSITVALLGLLLVVLLLFQYGFKTNLGIDNLFVTDYTGLEPDNPGRTSLMTTITSGLILSAIVLLVVWKSKRWANITGGVIGAAIMAFSGAAIAGYLFNIDTAYTWGRYSSMALHTSIGMALLGSAIVSLFWRRVACLDYNLVSPSVLVITVISIVLNLSIWAALVQQNEEYNLIHSPALSEDMVHQVSHLPNIVLLFGSTISMMFVVSVVINQRANRFGVAFRRGEEKFRLVVESAPCGMIMVNEKGVIELINYQVEKMFGYTRIELLGQHIESLLPERYRHNHVGLRNGFLNNPRSRPMGVDKELYGLQKNGDEFPLEIGLNPISSKDGMKVLTTIVDISERKKYLDELTRSNKELNDFAYVASHDLKAPLRAVDQLALWLTEDLGEHLTDEIKEYLRLMRVRINRMESLLVDLLAYSRVGREEDLEENVDLKVLIEDIFELCNANQGFTLTLEGKYPTLMIAKAPISQVFRNLISNAIKHHDQKVGEITVRASYTNKALTFEVQDDGPGIDPKFEEKAFAMFQTLRPRDEVEGSGMGLAIVKKTIERIGGTIHLLPTNGLGACFRFTWPAAYETLSKH